MELRRDKSTLFSLLFRDRCHLFCSRYSEDMFYVYLLRCADKRMYLGCSHDLKERIIKHNKGQVKFTKSRLPIKLISYFAFSQQETAFDFETYLKSGSGRAFLKKHFPLE